MQIRKWLAAALAVGMFATACGGDDTAGDTTGDTTTDTTGDATDGDTTEGMDDRSDWPEALQMGLVPSREADTIVEDVDALTEAMSEALGIEVEGFVSQDYSALTTSMAAGNTHIGAFGPLGIVRTMEQADVDFILQSQRRGSFTYHTQYMTNDPDTYCDDEPEANEDGLLFCNGTLDADEGPLALEALAKIEAGTKVAFVDPSSTSGYLVPAGEMVDQGLTLDELETTFAGGHDASVLAVYNGDVEVGTSFDDARTLVSGEFSDVGEKVVVFAFSQEIPNDGFVVLSSLPQSLKDAITEFMLDFAESEEGATVLNNIYEIEGLREADPAVLEGVKRGNEELGDSFGG